METGHFVLLFMLMLKSGFQQWPYYSHYDSLFPLKLCLLTSWLFAETQIFVDKLFEALNSKSYLPQLVPEQPASTSRPADSHQRTDKDEPRKEEVSAPWVIVGWGECVELWNVWSCEMCDQVVTQGTSSELFRYCKWLSRKVSNPRRDVKAQC